MMKLDAPARWLQHLDPRCRASEKYFRPEAICKTSPPKLTAWLRPTTGGPDIDGLTKTA